MKKLYKIIVQHVAPKDEHTSVECFLLAEDDEAMYTWLDKKKVSGCWSDTNEEDELYEIYDNTYKVIGSETYKERMLRLKGEYFDENKDTSDSYYGLTFYGWEEIEHLMTDEFTDYVGALADLKVLEEA